MSVRDVICSTCNEQPDRTTNCLKNNNNNNIGKT